MASTGPGTISQLWDCPDLHLHTVKITGKTLGCGSYGCVEEVEVAGTLCAAKKIHDFLTKEDPNWLAKNVADTNIQKFVSECKMMSRLRHPNIVQFLGIWISQASLYLVMEKMMMSLHEVLEPDNTTKSVQLSSLSCIILGLKYSILQDIARGLAFLHKQTPPVIHRDLSARNVLLNSAMVAKIADMGMARILPGFGVMMTKQPGACVYMPPEALEDRYDTSIDIFSFGVVALFVLAQEFPQDLKAATYTDAKKGLVARTELERREKYTTQITFPKTHPLVQLIESCLENRPEARPSIDQVLELLDQAVSGIQENALVTSSKLQLLELIQKQDIIIDGKGKCGFSTRGRKAKGQLMERSKALRVK